jgi:hypothetical protein
MAYTDIDKPTDYFETILYTGNGSSLEVNGLDFSPDWVWIKKRSNAANHMMYDTVRGIKKHLHTNTADIEVSEASDDIGLNSFDSDGFTVKVNGNTNTNTHTFASWNWLTGTSFSNDASSTSVGSIDSAGSVNTDAGFSIIGYTGDAQTGTTIAHGLGVKPNMIILKNREPDTANWQVYHSSLGATHYVQLNSTGAATDSNTRWNDVEPTSTVFTTGSSGDVCGDSSGETFIAYCFAEKQGYSKIGSYTGNGNANGPFVHTGFKPAWVLQKNAGATQGWQLQDNKREGYNGDNDLLQPHDSAAESGVNRIDILSNGFKVITTDAGQNSSGVTYIYMAFAESPFVTSTGIPTTAR